MLDKIIVDKINKQINFEFYSAYLYLDISNYYADSNLNWMTSRLLIIRMRISASQL